MGEKAVFLDKMLAVVVILVAILAVTAGKPTSEELVQADSASLPWSSKNGYVVPKTVVSERMSLIFAVGLEGTGHHMLKAAFSDMLRHSSLPYLDVCDLSTELYPGLVASLSKSPLAYAQAHERLIQRMKELAELEPALEKTPGTMVPLQFPVLGCPGTGMMSYPNFGGRDKALQYVDLPLMALAAEAAGVDLRLIYLSRSAKDVVISTTKHRDFDRTGDPGRESHSRAKSFVRYMQILITQATLVLSMLHEVDRRFVVCQRYDRLQSEEQIATVAEFAAPNPEVAGIFAASWKKVVDPTPSDNGDDENEPVYEGEEAIISRLQEILDALDAAFCRPL